ncbi:MAG: hypothetical protein IPQ10_07620 [Saprospiraceae bacterium]|jgi:hypothetical protein|nr:hypothetical protein [Saprospiraceae bacterium]MBK7795811.1 hypothetical protein [Saprospiraceae bacterium]MBK8154363.1 hypothetical protein [Saprospiraceae bacterium]MBK9379389.1 hypothetical protein [Saprospiraceae bacterium]MBL0260924.1 hypothetical protein [Saprospiraceae bacterium]
MKQNIFLAFFLGLTLTLAGQQDGTFRVEIAPFSPPIEAMIQHFEGSPVTPVMAPDLDQKMVTIDENRGRPQVLIFANLTDPRVLPILIQFANWHKSSNKPSYIIALMDETPEQLLAAKLKEQATDLTIIPNCKMLSEAVYGIELGVPRMFLIDQMGNIAKVFPAERFSQPERILEELDHLLP